jgi:hypothetical protein
VSVHRLHLQDSGRLFIIIFHFGPNLAFAKSERLTLDSLEQVEFTQLHCEVHQTSSQMDTPLFPDENSGAWSPLIQSQFQTFNMAAPQQHNTLAADAYAAATAMRDSLADNLAQWQILETRLRHARREVPAYCRSVFTTCDGVVRQFDNLSAHEVGQTTELQIFSSKFRSLKRDLERVLPMMTAECDIAPSAAQPALIASAHISTDPPMPPLPDLPPPVVALPYQAPQNDGAASHITSSTRELTTESSVDSVPLNALIHTATEDLKSCGVKRPERYYYTGPSSFLVFRAFRKIRILC